MTEPKGLASHETETDQAIGLWTGRRVCKRITAHYARTFYFASHCLPRVTRSHAYSVYAFCRWADNAVDDAESLDDAKHRLNLARSALDSAYSTEPVAEGLTAFRWTVQQCKSPRYLFEELLEGMAMDLVKSRYQDWPELDLYCYRVAGVVGLMMTHVFGFDDPSCFDQAKSLGVAMQLTNILRDIGEDFDRGRIYLPADEMLLFGMTEEQIASKTRDHHSDAFLKFQIQRARQHYELAEGGICHVLGSTHRMTIRVMGHLYGLILNEIEKLGYDIFKTRARVSRNRKLMGLAGCQCRTWAEDVWLALH